jgi:hypothetical protein
MAVVVVAMTAARAAIVATAVTADRAAKAVAIEVTGARAATAKAVGTTTAQRPSSHRPSSPATTRTEPNAQPLRQKEGLPSECPGGLFCALKRA